MQKVLFIHSFYIVVIKKINKTKHKDHLLFPATIWKNKWKADLIAGGGGEGAVGLKGYSQHTLKVACSAGNVNISSANSEWSYTCYLVL